MRILVWGLGYVGTVSAACFASRGHDVVGIEPNQTKADAINEGRSPVFEPGLQDLVEECVAAGRLRAKTSGTDEVAGADASLICVGTPSAPDGSPVLNFVDQVADDIGRGMQGDMYHTVILRSTVFSGTTRNRLIPGLERTSGLKAGEQFGVAMNPEFLREASAIADFDAPPYTVIGEFDNRSGDTVQSLYEGINAPVHRVGLEEAELLKVVNNSFHALKIGFANEVGRMSEKMGINGQSIMELVCADTKLNISKAYLRPGFAFGGSCLPKDLRSITYHAGRSGVSMPILEHILASNTEQIESVRRKVHALGAKRVGIFGLSFKSGTDDLRESPSIELIRRLWQDGMEILVYDPDIDPQKMLGSNREYLERQLPQINQILRPTPAELITSTDVLIITQSRDDFARITAEVDERPIILDLVQRRQHIL